jgi:hypothetical protein
MAGVLQLSVAVALPAAGTPVGLQPNALPAGQKVNTGGVLSTTFTVWLHTSGEPLQSAQVVVQVMV